MSTDNPKLFTLLFFLMCFQNSVDMGKKSEGNRGMWATNTAANGTHWHT